jgi:hypothetical protein
MSWSVAAVRRPPPFFRRRRRAEAMEAEYTRVITGGAARAGGPRACAHQPAMEAQRRSAAGAAHPPAARGAILRLHVVSAALRPTGLQAHGQQGNAPLRDDGQRHLLRLAGSWERERGASVRNTHVGESASCLSLKHARLATQYTTLLACALGARRLLAASERGRQRTLFHIAHLLLNARKGTG